MGSSLGVSESSTQEHECTSVSWLETSHCSPASLTVVLAFLDDWMLSSKDPSGMQQMLSVDQMHPS